jgi:hypothetical protein
MWSVIVRHLILGRINGASCSPGTLNAAHAVRSVPARLRHVQQTRPAGLETGFARPIAGVITWTAAAGERPGRRTPPPPIATLRCSHDFWRNGAGGPASALRHHGRRSRGRADLRLEPQGSRAFDHAAPQDWLAPRRALHFEPTVYSPLPSDGGVLLMARDALLRSPANSELGDENF